MYHIANDLRAKKSAALIVDGLHKALETKALKDVKISDIYAHCFVSRATFYRLFDSVYDVLVYECDQILDEMLQVMMARRFESKKEAGIFCIELWLGHDALVRVMVENNLQGLIYDLIMRHKDALKTLYNIDYEQYPYADYFVHFLVAMIFTSFSIFHREKGKRPVRDVIEDTDAIIVSIMEAWEIGG